MIKLGDKAKDVITGFVGIATGHCVYISGCNQWSLQPAVDDKGAIPTGTWFDEQRLVVIEASAVSLDNSKTPGFGSPAPIR